MSISIFHSGNHQQHIPCKIRPRRSGKISSINTSGQSSWQAFLRDCFVDLLNQKCLWDPDPKSCNWLPKIGGGCLFLLAPLFLTHNSKFKSFLPTWNMRKHWYRSFSIIIIVLLSINISFPDGTFSNIFQLNRSDQTSHLSHYRIISGTHVDNQIS